MILRNENLTYEKIKRILNSGKACHYGGHILLHCRLLLIYINFVILKNIILPLVQYWYGIWYFTLREQHRLRVHVERPLRGMS
jgi:hypothetical protein